MPKGSQVPDPQELQHLLKLMTGVDWKINAQNQTIWYVGDTRYPEITEKLIRDAKEQGVVLIQKIGNKGRPVLYMDWTYIPLIMGIKQAVIEKHSTTPPLNAHAHLDLHGFSEEKAKTAVIDAIREVNPEQSTLRIVTGRGNHINKRGERGALFQKLPNWLSESDVQGKVIDIQKRDGYYDLSFKSESVSLETTLINEMVSEVQKANFDTWKERADNGDRDAQHQMGLAHKMGIPGKINKNTKIAFQYFEKAAQQNHLDSQFQIGTFYWLGDGTKRNDEQAKFWLKKAADQGDVDAALNLAKILFQHTDDTSDNQEAIHYFAQIAEENLSAKRFLGHGYYHGKGIEKNLETAFQLYLDAAHKGDLVSNYFVAQCYREGTGTKIDYENAFEYYKKGAEGGDNDAKYYLAVICYNQGIGTNKSPEKTISLMEELSEAGHAGAHFYLYERLLKNKENDRGKIYLKRSAEAGFILAQVYSYISSVCNDEIAESKKWSNLILEQPLQKFSDFDTKLLTDLVFGLLEKELPKKHKQKCLTLLERCAEQKNVNACEQLGDLYSSGKIIPKNYQKAFYYWQLGSEQGHLVCLYVLAHYHENGIGTKKNIAMAENCLKRIEENNNPRDFYSLGLACQSGFGTPVNYERANYYFLKATFSENLGNQSAERVKIHSDSLCQISRLYFKGGPSLVKNEKYAILCLMCAAQFGNQDALTGLHVSLNHCFEVYRKTFKQPDEKEIDRVVDCFGVVVDCMEGDRYHYPNRVEMTPIYANACYGIATAFMILSQLKNAKISEMDALWNNYTWMEKAAALGHKEAQAYIRKAPKFSSK